MLACHAREPGSIPGRTATNKEYDMDNVVDFPTPREQAGVSMKEDMDHLVDGLMGAMLALKH